MLNVNTKRIIKRARIKIRIGDSITSEVTDANAEKRMIGWRQDRSKFNKKEQISLKQTPETNRMHTMLNLAKPNKIAF